MKKIAPQVVDSGHVVALAPLALTVKAAALFCACSASLLNQYRGRDVLHLQRGEPTEGPAWVRLPYGIRYRVSDLTAWLERTAQAHGVCESHRRSSPVPDRGGKP